MEDTGTEISCKRAAGLPAADKWWEPTPLGLKLLRVPTKAEWIETGYELDKRASQTLWLVGDWLLHGEVHGYLPRGKLDEACDQFEIARNTAKQAARVSRFFTEWRRRRHSLSWSHHQEVAGRDDADELLAWADHTRASISRLRREKQRRDQARLSSDSLSTEQPKRLEHRPKPPLREEKARSDHPPKRLPFSDVASLEAEQPAEPVAPPTPKKCRTVPWSAMCGTLEKLRDTPDEYLRNYLRLACAFMRLHPDDGRKYLWLLDEWDTSTESAERILKFVASLRQVNDDGDY